MPLFRLILLLGLSASTTHAEEDRVYAIQVHDLPNPSSVEYPPFQAMLDDHPQIRYERYSQLQLQGLERGSLLMSIAGGTAPDLLRVYHHEAKAWIRQGFFEPLDPYIYNDSDGDGRYTHGVDEVIYEPFLRLSPAMREMCMEDGHIYILPRYQWIQFLVYRKDLFIEAGLDPEQRIETFDDLKYVARKLTDPGAEIPGARRAHGRHGIGIAPNGWLWQGWLFASGGYAVKYLKTCPVCDHQNEFPQATSDWACANCQNDLRHVHGQERAAFNSPAGHRALKLWQDLLWGPFVKCPSCAEPVELGDAKTQLDYPLDVACTHCDENFTLQDEEEVIYGCARPMIDAFGGSDDWLRLFRNGEIAIFNFHRVTQLADSNIDSRIVGAMPYPERGGASAYHYYGIYSGAKEREGGQDRVRVCAEYILDYAAQFLVDRDDPRYLRYDSALTRQQVHMGFYNLAAYDELVAAGMEEYANEIPEGSRQMQRLIRDPNHYTVLPTTEGYSRIQQEVLGTVLLSSICLTPEYDIAAELARAEELANTQGFMKDEIVGELMDRYRLPFFGGVAALLSFVVFLGFKVLRDKEAPPLVAEERKLSLGKKTMAVLLILPAALAIGLWAYYPLVRGSIMAFQDVEIMGVSHFVDIENFVRVISNPQFGNMVAVTFIYVFAVLSLGFFAPVFLAIMLAEIKRFTILYRIIYYAPHLLSGTVVIFIWKIFYMPTPEGMLNELLGYLGVEPIRWLQDAAINKWALAIPAIWAGTGSASLVYLAAMKSIDDEMYEAAEIDGAGIRHKIFHVTIPNLKPLLIITFIGAFIGAFHGMANVLIMTGGAFETNVVGLQIFTEAFAYLRFGSATALAWILGGFLVSFTIVQLGFLKKVEFRRAE